MPYKIKTRDEHFQNDGMVDFTLGTHPITTKGTTELGRSEATKRFWCCLH